MNRFGLRAPPGVAPGIDIAETFQHALVTPGSQALARVELVDRDRLVVVRMILGLNPAAPAERADIVLRDYRPVGGGWLAVQVDIMEGGKVVQKEVYSDWRGNVELPADFFVAEKWSEVPHWATR